MATQATKRKAEEPLTPEQMADLRRRVAEVTDRPSYKRTRIELFPSLSPPVPTPPRPTPAPPPPLETPFPPFTGLRGWNADDIDEMFDVDNISRNPVSFGSTQGNQDEFVDMSDEIFDQVNQQPTADPNLTPPPSTNPLSSFLNAFFG